MKLKEWIPIWQEQYDAPSVLQSTYEAHRYVLENHILPRLGKWELTELTDERIRRFYNQCRKSGNLRTDQPLSDVTMQHIMILLRKILRQAVADGWLEAEPMAGWSFHETKAVKTETLTIQEVADYLDAAGQLGYGAMFTLAIHYGLRQRELIALKWSDVDIEKPSLTVHAGRVVKEGKLVEYAGKVRFHDLRHTFATVALQSGIDVKTVSNMLGHYSAGFTLDTYTHVTDQMQKAAAQRMQGVMDAALPDEQPDPPQDNSCKVIKFKKAVNA